FHFLDAQAAQHPDLFVIGKTKAVEQKGMVEPAHAGDRNEYTRLQPVDRNQMFHAGISASPRSRSACRSATASRPTATRSRPSLMPAAARASAEMRPCVVEAGWVM